MFISVSQIHKTFCKVHFSIKFPNFKTILYYCCRVQWNHTVEKLQKKTEKMPHFANEQIKFENHKQVLFQEQWSFLHQPVNMHKSIGYARRIRHQNTTEIFNIQHDSTSTDFQEHQKKRITKSVVIRVTWWWKKHHFTNNCVQMEPE